MGERGELGKRAAGSEPAWSALAGDGDWGRRAQLGFRSAVRDVWPETTPQRDWCHKMANVLDKLPKRLRPRAKRALREIMFVATKSDAETAIGAFVVFPAEHWRHLRTSNLIESPFATVRLRQRVTKGAGPRTNGLLMANKLLDMAQRRWRRLNGAHLLPLVRAGVPFGDGVPEEHCHTESEARKEAA